MEIKYEPVFGDQNLFDGAGTFSGLDVVVRSIASGLKSYARSSDLTPESLRNNPVCAMRRIISTPAWTVADHKAVGLPEAGAKVDGGVVVFVNGFNVITELESGAVIVSSPKTVLNTFKPIESPEERAKRVREEWCNSAAKLLKNLEYSSTLTSIYDAMLSGELKMPEVQ